MLGEALSAAKPIRHHCHLAARLYINIHDLLRTTLANDRKASYINLVASKKEGVTGARPITRSGERLY